MTSVELKFPQRVSAKFRPELTRRVLYLNEGIDDFSLIEENGEITGLRLRGPVADGPPPIDLVESLMGEVQGLLSVQAKRLWTSRRGPDAGVEKPADHVVDDLIRGGHARLHGAGTVSLRGVYAVLVDVIDDVFTALSIDAAGAENHRFPTLLGASVLDRGGYLDSFPNLLMTVARLRHTTDDFNHFREHRRSGGALTDYPGGTVPVDYCLPPTMCYYVYDSLAGSAVDDLRVFTAAGKSFRFEHRYESHLRRLWDFTIRETVWAGTREQVRTGLNRYRGLVSDLCDELGLSGMCESAHDPFFLADDGAAMAAAQEMIGTKSELRLCLGEGETVAAASFNLHGEYLAGRYGISLNDGITASTACVGVGLERFTLAFLVQHGIEPSAWPDLIRSAVAAETNRPARAAVRNWARNR